VRNVTLNNLGAALEQFFFTMNLSNFFPCDVSSKCKKNTEKGKKGSIGKKKEKKMFHRRGN